MAIKRNHARVYKSVPPFMRELRERIGLTQRDLARRVKEPQPWVHRCESGSRRVDVAEFVIWCRACEVDPVKALAELAADVS